jgi:hypothetical protein
MTRLRRMLRSATAFCFCCQIIGLTASPVALCLEASHASAGLECTCGHGGDQTICPMHHSTPARPRSKSDCSCRSTADPNAAVLVGLLGSLAVMPERVDYDTQLSMSGLLSVSSQHLPNPIVGPDGPPPRT